MAPIAFSSPAAIDAPASPSVAPIQRVVAAVRGAPSDTLVLRAAAEIARRHHAHLAAVTVFEPQVLVPHLAKTHRHPVEDHERHEAARWLRRVRAQLRAVRLPDERWPLHRGVGEPAAEIAKLAARLSPDLVVVGLGRPVGPERELGSRVALRLAQVIGRPLLAVARDQTPAWHSALALVDGQTHDRVVLDTAASLLEPPGRVLAVAAPDPRGTDHGVQAGGESASGVRYERVLADGEPLARALELGERAGADLIAAPLFGHTPAVRALTNHRAMRLLMAATCSVLLVPEVGPAPTPVA